MSHRLEVAVICRLRIAAGKHSERFSQFAELGRLLVSFDGD